jgi:streptogramin lyase
MRPVVATIATLALAALMATSALAAPAVDGEFSLSEKPKQITQGPDGNMWVTLENKKLAKVTPDGTVTEFTPAALKDGNGITTGPDGNLWVVQSGEVVQIPPGDPTKATAFSVSAISDPRGITSGPDGNLYAASADKFIQIPPGNPTTFVLFKNLLTGARGISLGGDNNLWVADFGGARVASITTGGKATYYNTGGGPQEVGAGPGTQMGYSNPTDTPESVGRINPPDPTPLETEPPGQGDPTGVVFGNDGAYWFARFATKDLFRLTPDGQFSTLGGFSAGAEPRYIAKGPNNTLWVTLETVNKVGRITGVEPPAVHTNPALPVLLPDTKAPLVTSLTMASAFYQGSLLARLTAVRRRFPVGTTIRFRVDEDSRTTLTFQKRAPGRRVGKRCLKPTRARRHRRRCTRYLTVRPSLVYTTKAGLRKVRFQGRLSRTRRLKPGPYRLTVVAKDAAGNKSTPKRKNFRLLRKPRRR